MFDDFASISRAKETWRILVKVIRARKGQRLSGRKLAFTLEVVLMDNKIHATIREGLIYRFERVLKEGHVYAITNFEVSFNAGPFMTDKHEFKINFQMNIEVKPMNKASITIETYTFVPLSDILYEDYDTDYLDDVIGFLTGVGTERVIDKEYVKTKMNTIEIESEWYFVDYDFLHSFIDLKSTIPCNNLFCKNMSYNVHFLENMSMNLTHFLVLGILLMLLLLSSLLK
ncbi:uncharacterized protein LOC130743416 isoform X2 [Lotus japonicus]|nr:uncharacterized protein LOC130743416 isoform X2 [Lotus japonicus]XP_057451638.1 uncharacterized protein LOC130743416 isoform X2 [Lotus japonicus]